MLDDVSPQRLYGLFKIAAPSTDELTVEVQEPAAPTPAQLIERLYQRLRQVVSRRERKLGEELALGDEIKASFIILVEGCPIPSGMALGATFELRDFSFLPDLVDHLIEIPVGDAKTFEMTLPQDYVVNELAGKRATAYAQVLRAWEVAPVDMEDVALLKAADLGGSLDEAFEILGQELDAELGEELLVTATQAVLEAYGKRVTEVIPEAAVDEELRRSWLQSFGMLFDSSGFTPELKDAALGEFMHDLELRAEAESHLRINLALAALIAKEQLKPEPETMETLIEAAAEGVGVTLEDARLSLKDNKVYAFQATHSALYLEAVEFLMSRAHVKVIDAVAL